MRKHALVACLSVALLVSCVVRGQRSRPIHAPAPAAQQEVLILGFMGGRNVRDDERFGVGRFAKRLRQMELPCVRVETIENNKRERAMELVQRAFDRNGDGKIDPEERESTRLILYGQSFGGAAVVKFARELKAAGIPVMLTVQVDAVGLDDNVIPANVAAAANLFQSDGFFVHGPKQIRAEDPRATQIIGNFQFDYRRSMEPQHPTSVLGVRYLRPLCASGDAEKDYARAEAFDTREGSGRTMSIRCAFVLLIVLCPAFCCGQATYTVPLEKLNTSLTVPAMTGRDGVVYVAYRSFDWLKQSDQLQVLAYDLNSHKVLRHGTIPVPKVHGARATNGLAISQDGTTLAYVEIYKPSLVLMVSVKDLSEVHRLNALPFTDQDYQRQFAGFDAEDHLSFTSINHDKPRFIRLSIADFKIVSDTRATAITRTTFQHITWNPVAGRFWLPDGGGNIFQFNEEGQPTGAELRTDIHQLDQGAVALGQSGVMAFYAMVSRGAVASYVNNKSQALELPCSPRPYGMSNDHAYVGAICITQPDRSPEDGGFRVLTSDFLLIRADGPRVEWREKMSALGSGDNEHFEWASAVIEHDGKKVRVVVPTKSPELAVYEVAIAQNGASPAATTH